MLKNALLENVLENENRKEKEKKGSSPLGICFRSPANTPPPEPPTPPAR